MRTVAGEFRRRRKASQPRRHARLDILGRDDKAIGAFFELARQQPGLAGLAERPALGILQTRPPAAADAQKIDGVEPLLRDFQRDARPLAGRQRRPRAALVDEFWRLDQRRGRRREAEPTRQFLGGYGGAIGAGAQIGRDEAIMAGAIVLAGA